MDSFFLHFWKSLKSGHLYCHNIPERASRHHDPIYYIPLQHLPKMLVNLPFHHGEGRSHLVGVHAAIDEGGVHGPTDSILIKAPKESIMEMRMIGFDTQVEYLLTEYDQIISRHGLLSYLEINFLGDVLGKFEVDYLIGALEGLLSEVKNHIKSILQVISIKSRCYPLFSFIFLIFIFLMHFIISL